MLEAGHGPMIATGVRGPGHMAGATVKDQVAITLHHKTVPMATTQLLSSMQHLARSQRISWLGGLLLGFLLAFLDLELCGLLLL